MADVRATRVITEALSTDKQVRATRIIAEALSTDKGVRSTRVIVEALYIIPPPVELTGTIAGQATVIGVIASELSGQSAGGSTVSGTLFQGIDGDLDAGPIEGTSTVTATLSLVHDLAGTSSGSASVVGAIDGLNLLVDWPIPYQVGFGGKATVELLPSTSGKSSVTGSLTVVIELSGSSGGSSSTASASGGFGAEHYWKLDETVGTFAEDTGSVGGQDGTYFGSPDIAVTGRVKTGLQGAVSDGLSLPGSFMPVDVFSFGIWFYVDSWTDNGEAVWFLADTSNNFSNDGWFIYWDPQTDELVFWVSKTGTPADMKLIRSNLSTELATSTWHHLAVVCDLDNGYAEMYLNNVLAEDTTFASGESITGGSSSNANIAVQRKQTNERWWEGRVDEVAFSPVAWTADEVNTIYVFGGSLIENIPVLQAPDTIEGVATVTALLQVLFVDGGELVNELSGTSSGSSTVTATGFITSKGDVVVPELGDTYLYFQVNSGFGFEDIDDASGLTGFVSQNYPDGDTELDFGRYLYHQVNVGFGFEDIDDASASAGFVSQNYPDGHTEEDFDRYLYHQVQVIKGFGTQEGRLIVRPGINDRRPYVPKPRPPSGKLT